MKIYRSEGSYLLLAEDEYQGGILGFLFDDTGNYLSSTSSNYDNIKSGYLSDYIQKDSTIIDVKKDLHKINEYFTKFILFNSIFPFFNERKLMVSILNKIINFINYFWHLWK